MREGGRGEWRGDAEQPEETPRPERRHICQPESLWHIKANIFPEHDSTDAGALLDNSPVEGFR